MIADNTPVLIGVGQSVERIDASDYRGLSAADLAADAARAAIADTGVDLLHRIDAIAAVRTFDDSVPFDPPFGKPDNFARAIARRLGIDPPYATIGPLGGDTPISLIARLSARIVAGETSVALIVGGEAISTVRHLQKQGETRDWAEDDAGPVDDPGAQLATLVKPYQLLHGLRGAPAFYGLIENARRGRLKLSRSAYAAQMGAVMAPFMPVAAANPYASSVVVPMSAPELIEIGPRNRMVADPYPLRLVARDQVNQGAALLLTSLGVARALGLAEHHWIYVHGLALGTERDLIERADLSASPVGAATIDAVLSASGLAIADVAHLDFYSSFPIAVSSSAIDALRLSPDDPRGLTVTGGLPFFGGPGNNYATHAVAAMVSRLRAAPDDAGLVFAHGGYMSKFGAIMLSARPTIWSSPLMLSPLGPPSIRVNWRPSGPGRILTYTILYANGHPVRAVIIGVLDDGARFIANERDAETLALCLARDPIGESVDISHAADGNRFTFA